MNDAVAAARAAIDAVHQRDPERHGGIPDELAYADAVEAWLLRLRPDADPILRLAARAQHLERWSLPRTAFPADRAGYLRWRTEQYRRQGSLAARLCRQAGIDESDALRVEALVAKSRLREADGQAIEDAACLVFLDRELAGFAADHPDYDQARYVSILAKTMRKMSASARAAAMSLPLPEAFAALLRSAEAALRTQPAS